MSAGMMTTMTPKKEAAPRDADCWLISTTGVSTTARLCAQAPRMSARTAAEAAAQVRTRMLDLHGGT